MDITENQICSMTLDGCFIYTLPSGNYLRRKEAGLTEAETIKQDFDCMCEGECTCMEQCEDAVFIKAGDLTPKKIVDFMVAHGRLRFETVFEGGGMRIKTFRMLSIREKLIATGDCEPDKDEKGLVFVFREFRTGRPYKVSAEDIPYMGNKSRREDDLIGCIYRLACCLG